MPRHLCGKCALLLTHTRLQDSGIQSASSATSYGLNEAHITHSGQFLGRGQLITAEQTELGVPRWDGRPSDWQKSRVLFARRSSLSRVRAACLRPLRKRFRESNRHEAADIEFVG